ncbi:MAG: hypothetical protein QM703_25450 [Gemmatales bacterium]
MITCRMHAQGITAANPGDALAGRPIWISVMNLRNKTQAFVAFTKLIQPISDSIEQKTRAHFAAAAFLQHLTPTDDLKKALTDYAKAFRQAAGRHHHLRRLELSITSSDWKDNLKPHATDLLIGAVKDDWTSFDTLVSEGTTYTLAKLCEYLGELAFVVAGTIEEGLIDDQKSIVESSLGTAGLTLESASGMVGTLRNDPRYMLALLESVREGEPELGQEETPSGEDNQASQVTDLGLVPALDAEAKAIAFIIKRHGDGEGWTEDEVAQAAGVNRRSLYKWQRYTQIKKGLKSPNNLPPRGAKANGIADAGIEDDE